MTIFFEKKLITGYSVSPALKQRSRRSLFRFIC